MLTLIVPIDLERRSAELLDRVNTLCLSIVNTPYSIAIGHKNRESKYDQKLLALIEGFNNKRIMIVSENIEGFINLSRLRNLAFSVVDTKYTLLLDVDIFFDLSMIELMLQRINLKVSPYIMSPCLYLTKSGTKMIQKNKVEVKNIIHNYFNFSYKDVSHIAMPSSIILLHSCDYHTVGGFYEGYTGHGYEDFDFMVRLSSYYKEIIYNEEFLIDETYKAPLLSKGFRAELAQSCMFFVIQKKFFFHLYHKKIQREEYYQLRKKNALLFQKRLKIIFQNNLNTGDKSQVCPSLLRRFFEECKHQSVDFIFYSVLFSIKQNKTLKKSIIIKLKRLLSYAKKIKKTI